MLACDYFLVCLVPADNGTKGYTGTLAHHWLLHFIYSGFCLLFPGCFLGVYHHRISCACFLQSVVAPGAAASGHRGLLSPQSGRGQASQVL